jgi:hypothetical protein
MAPADKPSVEAVPVNFSTDPLVTGNASVNQK